MGGLFSRFFAMLTLWFTVLEDMGQIASNVVGVGKIISETYLKEEMVLNAAELRKIEATHGVNAAPALIAPPVV